MHGIDSPVPDGSFLLSRFNAIRWNGACLVGYRVRTKFSLLAVIFIASAAPFIVCYGRSGENRRRACQIRYATSGERRARNKCGYTGDLSRSSSIIARFFFNEQRGNSVSRGPRLIIRLQSSCRVRHRDSPSPIIQTDDKEHRQSENKERGTRELISRGDRGQRGEF